MGCTHDGNELERHTTTADDSFNSTVMIPFIPNPHTTTTRPCNSTPTTTTTTTTLSAATPPPFYSFIPTNNLSPLNHHLATGAANISTTQSRTEFIEQPLGSSRWNPTPEQLLALEEMYRLGMRTPSAEQIQQIAKQLRRFGKIEGKNVFYWFQNHKARERQKRRREIGSSSEEKHHENDGCLEHKESGLRKGTSYDVEPTKTWTSSSNRSKHSEDFVSMHRSVSMAETGPHGWTQFDDRELQLQRKMISTNCCTVDNINATTWQTLEYFPSPSSPTKLMPHLFKATTSSEINMTNNHQNLMSSSSSSFMIKPHQEDFESVVVDDENEENTETLELFPLHSDEPNSSEATKKSDIKVHITRVNNTNVNPNQYIEFLPLKN